MVAELNNGNIHEKTKQGNIVLDFYAEWCGPCKMMAPMFEKASTEMDDVNFFKVNVDNNQQAAQVYAVRSIPTIVLIKNGQEVERIIGLLREDEFKHKVKSAFK